MSKTLWPAHEKHAGDIAASGPDWLRRLRQTGLARFRQIGFPTSRLEEWKATNIAAIAETVDEMGLELKQQ